MRCKNIKDEKQLQNCLTDPLTKHDWIKIAFFASCDVFNVELLRAPWGLILNKVVLLFDRWTGSDCGARVCWVTGILSGDRRGESAAGLLQTFNSSFILTSMNPDYETFLIQIEVKSLTCRTLKVKNQRFSLLQLKRGEKKVTALE